MTSPNQSDAAAGADTPELYRLARDWRPAKSIPAPIVAATDASGEIQAVLVPAYGPKVRAWSEFLRTRMIATNPHFRSGSEPRCAPIAEGCVPSTGPFGVIESTPDIFDDEPTFELGARWVAFLVGGGETAIGFVTFGLSLRIDYEQMVPEPQLNIETVWIDPMFRGQGLSHLLIQAVRVAAAQFFDKIPDPAGEAPELNLLVGAEVHSLSGGDFVEGCAAEIERVWVLDQEPPGDWFFGEVEAELRW